MTWWVSLDVAMDVYNDWVDWIHLAFILFHVTGQTEK